MKHQTRIINFTYPKYNFLLFLKLCEVASKKFIKFALLSNSPQKRRFFWERLGILSNLEMVNSKDKWVWIHANAIGEINASQALIQEIKKRYPDYRILLTTANFSADEMAFRLGIADAILFFPYDVPFIIRKFLKIFNPICIVIIECDIWPNFVKICKKKNIPVLIASGIFNKDNGRSLGLRYLYNYRFNLSADVLRNIDHFCMQTEADANRLAGVLLSRNNLSVTGNLKFSYLNNLTFNQGKAYYKRFFNIKETDPVFVAGNVHQGEDEAVVDAFRMVKEKIANAVMVLAPRFMEDVGSIESLLTEKGFRYVKRTELNMQKKDNADVILVDTMGELAKVYAMADAAFVGGSLVYLGDMFGGHNILEPAIAGVPVLFGPYMHNFQNLADLFCQRKAAIQVKDSENLASCVVKLLTHQEESRQMITQAMNIFEENKDIAERTLSLIDDRIK